MIRLSLVTADCTDCVNFVVSQAGEAECAHGFSVFRVECDWFDAVWNA